jgi:hypothetical protein
MSLRSHGQPTPGVGAAALIGVPVMVLLLVVVHSERERDLSQRDVQRLVPDEATNRRDIEKSRQPPRSSPHRLGEQVTGPRHRANNACDEVVDAVYTRLARNTPNPATPGICVDLDVSGHQRQVSRKKCSKKHQAETPMYWLGSQS